MLESPYAGEIEANVAYARRALKDCLLSGEAPIASHLLYTQPGVLDDSVPEQRALGIQAGLEWRTTVELQVFYTDRGWSRGMLAALEQCLAEHLDFELRALDGPVRMPSVLDEDIAGLMQLHSRHGKFTAEEPLPWTNQAQQSSCTS